MNLRYRILGLSLIQTYLKYVYLTRLTPFVYKWGLGPLRDRSVARNRSYHLCTLPKITNGDDRTKKILQILVFANGFLSSKQLKQLVFERSASRAKNVVQIFFIFETISPYKCGFFWHFFNFQKITIFFKLTVEIFIFRRHALCRTAGRPAASI